MKVILICLALFFVAALSQDANECLQWPTCKECIAHNLCGWCAVNVVYEDGTLGPRCAGKPQDPSHPPPGWKPWTCPKDFQNLYCYGYICDNSTYQCVSAGPSGGGIPLQNCLGLCFPPTYQCNSTTYQCYQVAPGHGTDIHTCEAQCKNTTTTTSTTGTTGTSGTSGGPQPQPPGYECDPTTITCKEVSGGVPLSQCSANCQNVTPSFIIGNYRGLEVDHAFLKGEWQMKISQSDIVIIDPTGKVWAKGFVRQSSTELWLVTPDGTRKGLFGINPLPEVSVLTWAMGAYGGPAPASFDDGLTNGQSFVFAKCLSDTDCKWHLFQALNKLKLAQKTQTEKKTRSVFTALDDPCSKYPDCHTCIAAPEWCGWCSVPVLYNNTIVGKNCAGLNTTVTPRLNCTGTFSTVDCTVPTTGSTSTGTSTSTSGTSGTSGSNKKYYCDPVNTVCVQSDNGTLDLPTCTSQCTVVPFVPIVLQDRYFRGLEIDLNYQQGEWRAHFSKIDVTVVSPSGVVVQGNITTTGEFMTIRLASGNIQTIWQDQPGPSVDNLSWAWGVPGGPVPASYSAGMTTTGQTEYWFVACHQGLSTSVCDFSH